MAGMTPEGFIPKRTAEILTDLNDAIADIVDPASGEFPFRNVSDDSILQQVIGVFAEALAEVWNAAYTGSVQFDPLKNTGAGQSGTVQLNAMLRKIGTPTILMMRFSGNPGTTIPVNARFSNAQGNPVFTCLEEVTLDQAGLAEAKVQATEKGAFDPTPGTIVVIQTTVSGLKSVTNLYTDAVGTKEETDEELRRRQQRSTSLTSYRIIEAIYAAVYNVPGVIYARAYQNSTVYPADSRGIPFKEVAVVAEGGGSREIADAIFFRLPTGQIGYGNTTEVFYDRQGIAYPISFSRPVDVPIYVSVVLQITERRDFPDDYANLVRQNILDYVVYGDLGNSDGFTPGEDIILTRLFSPINRVAGHKVESLRIGLSWNSMGTADIPIAWDQVGRFAEERIHVSIGY